MRVSTIVRLFVPLGSVLFAAAAPVRAQPARVEVGLGYAQGDPFLEREFASLGAAVRLGSVGPLSVMTEASAMVRLPTRVARVCVDVPGFVCDRREVGDVGRVGLHARLGRRDGSGPYALATVGGWVTRLSGDVVRDSRIIERGDGLRAGGVVSELGAGTSLPFGDRRTGIEARAGWFSGFRAGQVLHVALTRRW